MRPRPTSCVGLGRIRRPEFSRRVANVAKNPQGSRGGCRYLAHKRERAGRSAGLGHQPRRPTDRPRPRSGVPVAGVGVWSPRVSRAATQRSLPARPKASALRPGPRALRPAERVRLRARALARLGYSRNANCSDRRRAGSAPGAPTRIRLVPGLTSGAPAVRGRSARRPPRRPTPARSVATVTTLAGAQPELGRGRAPVERERAHAVGVDEHHELRRLGVGERVHPAGAPRRSHAGRIGRP